MSWRRFSTSAVAAALFAIAGPAFAESPRDRARAIVESGPYQSEFPGERGVRGGAGGGGIGFGSGGGSVPGPSGGGSTGGGGGSGGPAHGPRNLGGGGGGAPSGGGGPGFSLPGVGAFGSMLSTLVIALLAVAIVAVIVGLLLSRSPAPEIAPETRARTPSEPRREPVRRGDLRREAEALAAQGRYDEAIHLLLLAAILHLSRGAAPPESRTSRELLAHFRLDGGARESFAALVLAVERSLFGGQPLGPAEWEECAGRHDTLVRTLS